MAENLPPELIVAILTRLPVKSLLRFRSVSKFFCSTIDDYDFIKHHLSQSLQNNTNVSLVSTDEDGEIISFELGSLENPVVINNPLKHRPKVTIDPIGVSNGLLCLGWYNTERPREVVALVNIATQKNRILPLLEEEPLEDESRCAISFTYAFGYDPLNDDYKVVKLTNFDDNNGRDLGCQLMIYSLKENAWRKVIKDFPYSLGDVISSIQCVSGKIHFLIGPVIGTREVNMIVAFDLSTEEFNELPLPDPLLNVVELYLVVLEGYLGVVSFCDGAVAEDIWVMKEYGIKESWTKLFSLPLKRRELKFPNLQPEPVACSRNFGKVLLKTCGRGRRSIKLAWYDVHKKKMEIVGKLPRQFSLSATVESLIPL